ncbi:MAG: hypothetical protein IH840_10835 [Candidatus Heimdallarchaeota archaeon]|nr:hypothetical protein [Candidatus Heimdallarchaeota archaeon]
MFTELSIYHETLPHTPTFVRESWNKIDVESTVYSFQRSLDMDTQVRDDVEWGRILGGVDLVINDIESIHNVITTKMKIFTVNISNFTWSDILLAINHPDLANSYAKLERLADLHIKLPFSTSCMGFRGNVYSVGLLANEIDWRWVHDQKKGLDDQKRIYINIVSMGNSFNLTPLCELLIQYNYKPILPRNKSVMGLVGHLASKILFFDPGDQVQNYVAIAHLVIGKTGYGTVSECYSAGTPFLHWIRDGFKEDLVISEQIEKDGAGVKLSSEFDEEEIISHVKRYISRQLKPVKNDNLAIMKLILTEYKKYNETR